MKYAGIIKNDLAAAPGICVSFFTQGCPHHCEGCQNPETWDFDGGKEFTNKVLDELGWQKRPTLTFPIYGKQRAFVRPIEEDDSDL